MFLLLLDPIRLPPILPTPTNNPKGALPRQQQEREACDPQSVSLRNRLQRNTHQCSTSRSRSSRSEAQQIGKRSPVAIPRSARSARYEVRGRTARTPRKRELHATALLLLPGFASTIYASVEESGVGNLARSVGVERRNVQIQIVAVPRTKRAMMGQ